MLIICPNCTKSYHIARDSLGSAGRTVQCSKCLSHWHCTGEPSTDLKMFGSADEHDFAAHDLPAPAKADEIAPLAGEVLSRNAAQSFDDLYGKPRSRAKPPLKRNSGSRSLAWQMVAAAVVLTLAMGAIAGRETLVAHSPALGYVYAGLGLPVNPQGIAFGPVRSALAGEGANAVLSVEGTMTNQRSVAVKVPQIIAALKGKDGRDVYSWTSPAPKATLGPGETTGFRTRLAAPPGSGDKVVLRFARADEMVKTGEMPQK